MVATIQQLEIFAQQIMSPYFIVEASIYDLYMFSYDTFLLVPITLTNFQLTSIIIKPLLILSSIISTDYDAFH